MCASDMNVQIDASQGNVMVVDQLVDQFRAAIESGKIPVGHKVATLRTIATQNDISYDAARTAMAKLEGLGYLVRRQGSGTFVTDWKQKSQVNRLRRTDRKTVAMLLYNKVHLYGLFYDRLVSSLQLGGFPTNVFTWKSGWGYDEMTPVLDQLEEAAPHAIVIQQICSGAYDSQVDAIARRVGTRVISSFLCSIPRPEGWCQVHCSMRVAASLAARHLIDKGHRKIGVVTHQRYVNPSVYGLSRKRLFNHTDVILGVGHELRNENLQHALRICYHKRIDAINGANPDAPENVQRMKQWLRSPDCPTAFIGDDYMVAALLKTASENHIRLPKNFEVVGIGNTPWSSFMNFSSVWLREDVAAEHVVNLIKMEDRLFQDVEHQIKIKPQLVIRER